MGLNQSYWSVQNCNSRILHFSLKENDFGQQSWVLSFLRYLRICLMQFSTGFSTHTIRRLRSLHPLWIPQFLFQNYFQIVHFMPEKFSTTLIFMANRYEFVLNSFRQMFREGSFTHRHTPANQRAKIEKTNQLSIFNRCLFLKLLEIYFKIFMPLTCLF